MTDSFKRRQVSDNTYQCGCHWIRLTDQFASGDRLIQCPIHQQATAASLKKTERTMKYKFGR